VNSLLFAIFELELELIQTQMAQKPMLRAEVYAHAMRASQNRKKLFAIFAARAERATFRLVGFEERRVSLLGQALDRAMRSLNFILLPHWGNSVDSRFKSEFWSSKI